MTDLDVLFALLLFYGGPPLLAWLLWKWCTGGPTLAEVDRARKESDRRWWADHYASYTPPPPPTTAEQTIAAADEKNQKAKRAIDAMNLPREVKKALKDQADERLAETVAKLLG